VAALACDPTALDRAGATAVATGVSLGSVISALTATLAGSAGMAGDDPVGAALGHSYDHAAAKVIDALAEAMSDVTGRATGLPTPQVTGPLSVGTPPPTAVGAGSDARAGWGWVAPYIGMIWPNGDSAKLRAAAAAWTTARANFMATETAAGGGLMAALAARQIPEGAAINKALSDASDATIDVGRQCETIAAQLTGYAAGIGRTNSLPVNSSFPVCRTRR
jgi:hypothetical protein